MVEVQATSESRSATCWNMLVQLDGAVYDLTVHLLNGQIDFSYILIKKTFSQLLLNIIGAGNLYKSQYHIVFRGHLDGSSNGKDLSKIQPDPCCDQAGRSHLPMRSLFYNRDPPILPKKPVYTTS